MTIKNKFFSTLMVGAMFTSAAYALDAPLSKEGDVTLTLRGSYLRRDKLKSSDTTYLKQISKKNGWGGEIQGDYYVTPNMSVVAAVGYQKFDSVDNAFVSGATGPALGISTRAIPVRLGVLFHANSFNGMRPYVGGGYAFTNLKNKVNLTGDTTPAATLYTLKSRNSNSAYVQAGLNYVTTDGIGFNLDVQKQFSDKSNQLAITAPVTRTTNIKYSPWVFGLGVVIAGNE